MPLLVCNTTRSPDSDTAVKRAKSGFDAYGINKIKLEVTRPVPWRAGYHRLVPVDEEVITANKILIAQDFDTVPLISCYPGGATQESIRDTLLKLIEDGASGIRLCIGRVGDNSGIEDEELLKSTIDFIRSRVGEEFPIITECGMTPSSIKKALEIGATACLANYYVSSSTNPVIAAQECIAATNEGYKTFSKVD